MLSNPGPAMTMTAVSLGRRLPTLALGTAAFIAPLLAIYAPLGMATLLAVVAVLLAVHLIVERRFIQLRQRAVWIGAALVAWGALSLTWTINPKAAWVVFGQVFGFFLCVLVVLTSTKVADSRPVAKALLIGIMAALAIYAVEWLFGAPIQILLKPSLLQFRDTEPEGLYSSFNRGLAVLIVLTPATIITYRKAHPVLCVILAGAVTAVSFGYYGAAMDLAAVLAIAVFVAALSGPWLARLIGVIALIAILAAPFVAQTLITPDLVESVSRRAPSISAQHRLVIWHFVSERIREKPLLGWGLDSARAIPGGKQEVHLHTSTCQGSCIRTGEQLPLHPHNLALQLWLELGAVGAALGGTIILGIFWLIAAAPVSRLDRALLAAQASAGLVIAGLSYGAWQIWWLSALALAGALSLCAIGQRNDQDSE